MNEMGIVIGRGLRTTLVKMNWKGSMRMLSSPLFVDAFILVTLVLIHWGTYSGVMVATVGAMTGSLTLSAVRARYGHVEAGDYLPGYFHISSKL